MTTTKHTTVTHSLILTEEEAKMVYLVFANLGSIHAGERALGHLVNPSVSLAEKSRTLAFKFITEMNEIFTPLGDFRN